jgi:Restriction endonuclease S subunits
LVMGQSPPGSTYNESGEGTPFYQGVRDFGERHPTRRVYCTAPKHFAETGDILFSVRAPIGEINRATEGCSIGWGLAAIRADSSLDTTYIEYVLRYVRREWEILEGQGAVFGNAKKSDLENLPVPWPDDEERRAIVHILGSLDDKIELNRRMNETLEAMARAIFKSWFVDFDPVYENMKRKGAKKKRIVFLCLCVMVSLR